MARQHDNGLINACLVFSVPALFADDTNLKFSGATASEIQDKFESELNKIHLWLLATN